MGREFEWNEHKRHTNLKDHGVDFADILPLFGQDAVVFEDDRKDYGERRYILMGELNGVFFQVAFTIRGTAVRIISARRGNRRERRIYEQEKRETD
jgi:uncharacterized DUF497 family protein